MISKLLAILSILLSGYLWAGDSLVVGTPRIQSANCPVKTADAVFDSKLSELRLGFDGFSLQAGGSSPLIPTSLERQCNIRVGIQLPPKVRLKITHGEFLERIVLPCGSQARLEMEVHKRGELGQAFVKDIRALNSPEDILIKRALGDLLKSGCGESFDLEININARLANSDLTNVAKLGLSKKDLRESEGQGALTSDGSVAVLKTELEPCVEAEPSEQLPVN